MQRQRDPWEPFRLWLAFTMNAGQTCMAPRRALVDRSVYRAFLDAMAPLATPKPPAPPKTPLEEVTKQ